MADMEKMYCGDNSAMLAELIQANKTDMGAIASMLQAKNGNRDDLLWIILLFAFGGGGFGFNRNGQGVQDAEIMAKLNAIQAQAGANQNTNYTLDAIKNNTNVLNAISNTMGVSNAQVVGKIDAINAGLGTLSAQMNTTKEAIANAILLGNNQLSAQLSQCCCENKLLVSQMGYEGQIRDLQNTASINTNIEGTRQAVVNGFANLGYTLATQVCDLKQAGNANTQRIIDTLNGHWQTEQALALSDAKNELSQYKQSAYLISQLKTTA